MRVLLDECLPRRLKRWITGHEVLTVPEAGWAGQNNGDLLSLAEGRFDIMITVDRNFAAQQRRQPALAIVILVACSNVFRTSSPCAKS
jgi:predicted nuclease of predicted toxin-antitoxin system